MDVVGYTDHVSVAPGEAVSLFLSCADPEVDISLVPLHSTSADALPAESAVLEATLPAGRQPLRPGSYVRIDDDPRLRLRRAMTVTLWVRPTLVDSPEQALIARTDHHGVGWRLTLTRSGHLRFFVGDGTETVVLAHPTVLRDHRWYFVAAVFDGLHRTLQLMVSRTLDAGSAPWATPSGPEWAQTRPALASLPSYRAPLLIAGAAAHDEMGDHVGTTFNGKIARPRLFATALTRAAVLGEAAPISSLAAPDLVGAWDFGQEIDSERVVDASGNGLDGRTVQRPTRAVTGPAWDGSVASWTARPDLYDAIHFHDDDLDDAGWEPTLTWEAGRDLPSGLYAFHVRGRRSEDRIPVVVRPPRDRATADVLVVAPLFSWLAYANSRSASAAANPRTPRADYALTHGLHGLYDRHTDASSVSHSSWRRPCLNIRPDYRLDGVPHQLSADLLLHDWLRFEGIRFDVATDADLHQDGADLLSRYRVVIAGTHTEYWSGPMFDGLAAYLGTGGRYMYLSGNGLYRVTAFQDGGHTVEVRRQDGSGIDAARRAAAGEGYTSFTGESGESWRWRGRPPQRYVGVGMSGLAFAYDRGPGSSSGAPYRRLPGSEDPRAAFVCDGIDRDELIGAFPNAICHQGAAGFEVDRADVSLGTPEHALVIASATAEPEHPWTPARDDEVDSETVRTPAQTPVRGARSDLVFYETTAGGAVFAAGSVAWCGGLPYNGYKNTVATVTRNVLRRFLSPEPFEGPGGSPPP